jgi:hypothetical protein
MRIVAIRSQRFAQAGELTVPPACRSEKTVQNRREKDEIQ